MEAVRKSQEDVARKEKSRPGSGNIWKSKLTIPVSPKLTVSGKLKEGLKTKGPTVVQNMSNCTFTNSSIVMFNITTDPVKKRCTVSKLQKQQEERRRRDMPFKS